MADKRYPLTLVLSVLVALVISGLAPCDVWDTQWDMFLALIGAVTAQLLLGGVHDRALARLAAPPAA